MVFDEPSGMRGIMINDIRRDGLIALMTDCRKETLKQYLKSHKLPVSGTKLQLAIRIWDNTKLFTVTLHMPPSGTVSIGVALDMTDD